MSSVIISNASLVLDDILPCFKVQELQDLIRVMPENQKIALWDCWDAAQKFINSCFGKVLEGSNIKEHIGTISMISSLEML